MFDLELRPEELAVVEPQHDALKANHFPSPAGGRCFAALLSQHASALLRAPTHVKLVAGMSYAEPAKREIGVAINDHQHSPSALHMVAAVNSSLVHEAAHLAYSPSPPEGLTLRQWNAYQLLEDGRAEYLLMKQRPDARLWLRRNILLSFGSDREGLVKSGLRFGWPKLAVSLGMRADAGVLEDKDLNEIHRLAAHHLSFEPIRPLWARYFSLSKAEAASHDVVAPYLDEMAYALSR